MFLRTAEKKREASRPKESKDSAPATPVEAVKPSLPAPEAQPSAEAVTQPEANGHDEEVGPALKNETSVEGTTHADTV